MPLRVTSVRSPAFSVEVPDDGEHGVIADVLEPVLRKGEEQLVILASAEGAEGGVKVELPGRVVHFLRHRNLVLVELDSATTLGGDVEGLGGEAV